MFQETKYTLCAVVTRYDINASDNNIIIIITHIVLSAANSLVTATVRAKKILRVLR